MRTFLALCAESAAGTVVRAEELEKLIFLDRLTGLYNRAYFDDQSEHPEADDVAESHAHLCELLGLG